MNRVALVLLVTALVFPSVAVAQENTSVPSECRVPDSQLSSSEEVLCEDIYEKNRRIQDLQFQQNKTDDAGVFSANNSYFRSVDAWDPRTEEPAVWIVRTRDPDAQDPNARYGVFQYVGEGFGDLDIDNDGTKSWKKVPISTQGEPGFGTVEAELYYTVDGLNATVSAPQSNAQEEFQAVGNELNTATGFAAWQRWRAQNEKKKGQIETGVFGIFVFLLPTVGGIGIYTEAKTSRLRFFLEAVDRKKRRYDGMGTDTPTWKAVVEAWRDR